MKKQKVTKKSNIKLGEPVQIGSNQILKNKSKKYGPDVELILDDLETEIYGLRE